jgi:hypothetical protein
MIGLNNNNKTYIIDNQFFGCINSYSKLIQYSNIKIEQFDNWQKMSFRNRCVVAGSNGLIHLTVPVEKGRDQKSLYKDVRINYTGHWQKQHWRTIFSCYGKAPFFEYYRFWIETFFLEKKFEFLFDMNLEIMDWVCSILKCVGKYSLTHSFRQGNEIVDYRNKWLPKNFQSGEGGIKYFQLFEDKIGFQSNLSILDLLFCEGPNSIFLLKQQNA